MQIDYVDPDVLTANDWNPNEVNPINQEKLINSIKSTGMFKPVTVRTLEDGTLQILGGEHRVQALKTLNQKVPIWNMGRISESEAKKITMLDNSQYGDQNDNKFIELFESAEWSVEDYTAMLPVEKEDLTNIFDHITVDLSEFDQLEDDEEPIDLDIGSDSGSNARSHQIIRFKVSLQDAHLVTDKIEQIKKDNGFTEGDELTNAGDALIHLFKELSQ